MCNLHIVFYFLIFVFITIATVSCDNKTDKEQAEDFGKNMHYIQDPNSCLCFVRRYGETVSYVPCTEKVLKLAVRNPDKCNELENSNQPQLEKESR